MMANGLPLWFSRSLEQAVSDPSIIIMKTYVDKKRLANSDNSRWSFATRRRRIKPGPNSGYAKGQFTKEKVCRKTWQSNTTCSNVTWCTVIWILPFSFQPMLTAVTGMSGRLCHIARVCKGQSPSVLCQGLFGRGHWLQQKSLDSSYKTPRDSSSLRHGTQGTQRTQKADGAKGAPHGGLQVRFQ